MAVVNVPELRSDVLGAAPVNVTVDVPALNDPVDELLFTNKVLLVPVTVTAEPYKFIFPPDSISICPVVRPQLVPDTVSKSPVAVLPPVFVA